MTTQYQTQAEAAAAAEAQTAATGVAHIAAPFNPGSRFDNRHIVFRLPQVGDVVSQGFNGDYYPEGTITRIHANHRTIFTSNGGRFSRVSDTSWKSGGKRGAFSLVQGNRDERNPCF